VPHVYGRATDSLGDDWRLLFLRPKILRITRPRRRYRSWRGRRRLPGHIDEVKKLQQVGLRHVAIGKVCVRPDETAFHKLDNRRMVHGRMRDKVSSGKRRYDHVREPEAKLRRKTLLCRGIAGIGAGLI